MNYREVLLRLIAYTTPYVYDNNISLLELTRKLYKIVNELCQAMKEMSDEMDGIKETITDTTRTVLLEMKDDGTLAEIINQEVFGEIQQRLSTCEETLLLHTQMLSTINDKDVEQDEKISTLEESALELDEKITENKNELEKLNIGYSDNNNVLIDKDLQVDDIQSKNLFDKYSLVQGDQINALASQDIRITSRQRLFLKKGVYTFSTSLNLLLFDYAIQLLELPSPTQDYSALYNTGYVGVDKVTINVAQDSFFQITIKEKQNNQITLDQVINYDYQLEHGENKTSFKEHKNIVESKILYNNNQGANGDFTLYDDIRKYEFIEIFYNERTVRQCSTKIKCDGYLLNVPLTISFQADNDYIIRTSSYTFNGNQATKTGFYAYTMNKTSFQFTNQTDSPNASITVSKVVGYR